MSAGDDTRAADRAMEQWQAQRNALALESLRRLERERLHQRARECARLWAERSANTQQEQQP